MKEKIAQSLLSIGAVFLRPNEPFTWASGIKSPIYCDNRLTLTSPTIRTIIETGLMNTIKENYPDCEIIMGTSTAGIAHAAIVGHMMNLPMGYVRGSSKDHGRNNQIEGKLLRNQKVVVIEAGANVLGVDSIFTYGMQKATDNLEKHNVKNISLCDLDTLVEVAEKIKYIKEEDKSKIIGFRNNPSDENWMKG